MKTKYFSLSDELTFGRYKGYTIEEVIEDNPDYIEWAIDEIEWFTLDDTAYLKLLESPDYFDDEYYNNCWHDAFDLLA